MGTPNGALQFCAAPAAWGRTVLGQAAGMTVFERLGKDMPKAGTGHSISFLISFYICDMWASGQAVLDNKVMSSDFFVTHCL